MTSALAERLLRVAGLGAPLAPPQLLPGGRNNRAYRVAYDGGAALLKVYFRHPGDSRDRRGAEWAFASFAWNAGLRCLPQPLASDESEGASLFEFVDGRPVEAAGEAEVAAALDFVAALNRNRAAAAPLAPGSEACFTIGDHLACVERRLKRLDGVEDQSCSRFIAARLIPAWTEIAGAVAEDCRRLGLDPAQPLLPEERCVSPSDFGFHNALRRPDGRLCFVDFEYAGWDDPAKLVGDFFCQPDVPVSLAFAPAFAAGVAAASGDGKALARMSLLLPVYVIKWCCILLNEFLPVDGARRAFAVKSEPATAAGQLSKAARLLDALPAYRQREWS